MEIPAGSWIFCILPRKMFFLNIHVLSCRNEHSQSLAYRNTLLPRFIPRVQTLREHWLMPPAVCLALNKTQLSWSKLMTDCDSGIGQTVLEQRDDADSGKSSTNGNLTVHKMLLFVNDTISLNSWA